MRSALKQLEWLSANPRLDELIHYNPELWELTVQELTQAARSGRYQKLNDLSQAAKTNAQIWEQRLRKGRNNPKVIEVALPQIVKSRMFLLALDKCNLAAAAGQVSGKVRLNLWNGYLIQKMFFSRHLTRKVISWPCFKLLWPLITQKKLLMPLVQSKGIYCFYSQPLIKQLCKLIGGRRCLEIGAGDGTLTRFLNDAGQSIIATDDYSWQHVIEYPASVEKLEAKPAIAKYQPEVVLCSWPPPDNNFERHIFTALSVKLYIAIGSRYKFASGNWEAYTSQNEFEWNIDSTLSRYVIPPELDSAVLVFRRKIENCSRRSQELKTTHKL